jgi:hypothetical protein
MIASKAFVKRALRGGREEARNARQTAESGAYEVQRLEAGLREVRGKLEQRRQDTFSQKSQGAVAQALMAAKASGEIPGIYGRLGRAPHATSPSIEAASNFNGYLQRCSKVGQWFLATFLRLQRLIDYSSGPHERKRWVASCVSIAHLPLP